jgi:hypothetical protein
MKKQTLEEQVSRIKGMIKSVNESVHTDDEKESYQEFDVSQDRKDTIVMRVFLNMLLNGLYGVEDIQRLVTRDRHLSDESKHYILNGDNKNGDMNEATDMEDSDIDNEPKFEHGDIVHNLERMGQYPWRVVDVYRNFNEVLDENGEGEDTFKLYYQCRGDADLLNSPIYRISKAGRYNGDRSAPDSEYQIESQMSHWDDQGEGVEIDEDKF